MVSLEEDLIKRKIPLAIIFIIGFGIMVAYFIDLPISAQVESNVSDVASVIASYTAFVGLIALVKRQSYEARRRVPGRWFLSIWCIFVAVGTSIVGITLGPGTPLYSGFFELVIMPIRISMIAIYIFALVNAIYLGVIVKNVESALFAACLIILGFANAPTFLLIIPGLEPFSNWLINVVNVTSSRVATIGATVGLAIIGIKIMLGKQPGFLKKVTEEGES